MSDSNKSREESRISAARKALEKYGQNLKEATEDDDAMFQTAQDLTVGIASRMQANPPRPDVDIDKKAVSKIPKGKLLSKAAGPVGLLWDAADPTDVAEDRTPEFYKKQSEHMFRQGPHKFFFHDKDRPMTEADIDPELRMTSMFLADKLSKDEWDKLRDTGRIDHDLYNNYLFLFKDK